MTAEINKLRRSFPMPTHQGMKAYVGWDENVGTYWFAIVRLRPVLGGEEQPDFDDVFYARGDETDRITNVGDLVRATWGEIYWWDAPPKVLYLLRDEPHQQAIATAAVNETYYPLDVEDYIFDTLDSFLSQPSGQTPTAPEPTPPDAGTSRRGFFSRR